MLSSLKAISKIHNSFAQFSSTLTSELVNKLSKEYTMWSWSAQAKVAPIAMAKSKGVYFWDFEGKRYFDMNSQLMCSNIGHQHPKVIEAIKKQAEELCQAGPGFSTKIRSEIGKILAKHTPGDLKKFFFCLGGAEANENAIKFAKFQTKRQKIITRYRAYHGASQGAVSLTGDFRRWPNEPSMPGIIRISDPYKYRSLFFKPGMTDEEFSAILLKQLEEVLIFENPENVAAIFMETVTGTNGLIVPPQGYLQGIRKICDKYGIVMIVDEVMCGLGRTGEWYAVDHWNVVPDIITMAKGLTAAYLPLGALAINKKIAKEFDERVFSGGLTQQSHPMCLAASKAVMEVMEEEDVVGNAKRIGQVMASIHEELKEKHPSVGDARSIGLFGCIELVKNKETKEPLCPYLGSTEAMIKTMAQLKANGIYAFNWFNLLHTSPPLVVNESELREAFEIVDKALDIADKYVTK